MKTKIVLICAAISVMLAACCGGNSQSSSCPKEKACCKEVKAGEKACCKDAAKAGCCKDAAKTGCCKDAAKSGCCKDAGKAGEKACCMAAGVKKVISAQVFIKPEKVDAFVAATKDLIEKSRAEAGCISYSLYQDPQDKTKFLFFEEWKNQAAVDFHFDTDHFKKFGETLNDCASEPAVITIYDSVAEKKV